MNFGESGVYPASERGADVVRQHGWYTSRRPVEDAVLHAATVKSKPRSSELFSRTARFDFAALYVYLEPSEDYRSACQRS